MSRTDLDFSIASADASFRRYFRARDPVNGTSWIIMDAPPEREDCGPFIDIAARLLRADINAPQVLDHDLEQGFLLLTDLGTKTFLDVLDDNNADALFSAAMKTLVQMQARASTDGLPPYETALLRRELNFYPEWYLGRHRGVTLSKAEIATWEQSCRLLIESALAQPQVLVHRDFMPRNLMVSGPMPGVIDFQDAVRGPVTYDLLSLYRDAFISWPNERVAGWIDAYRAMASASNVDLPEDFERALDWMGLQRYLKVIGIFARLHYRDGKQKYLAEIPRFLDYAFEFGAKYREFDDLLAIMRKYEAAA
ncbi:MAG: phosphotransferase [Proteobacteria bacterium]|nr:phosphotransferase [Pseudomonadota bacterium]